MTFELSGALLSAVDFDLKGNFKDPVNLGIAGGVQIGIDDIDLGPLGTIPIDTGVGGNLAIGVKNEDIYAKLDASFELLGEYIKLPSIKLDIETEALKGLVPIAWEKVKASLEELFKDAEKWAESVAKGVIKGIEDVEKVLGEIYHLSPDEVKKIMDTFFSICAMTSAFKSML